MATASRAGESHAEGRFPWTRVNPLQPTGANAISGIWHSAFGSHSIVPVRVVTGTTKILAISKLAWPPLIAKLRNTCYRVTKVCEEAIKIYFADTRAHFLPKQLATWKEISSILLHWLSSWQNICIAGSKFTTTAVKPPWSLEFMKPVYRDQNYNGKIRLHTNLNFKLL